MVKKILLALIIMSFNFASAINWVDLTSPKGKAISLDVDSIKEYKNFYFYNVKMKLKNGEDTVITIQAQKTHPFCARVKYYNLFRYNELNGDYENITNTTTTKLEPVTFESRANTAYRKVVELKKAKPKITF
ncbi:MAG: hypothetical protein IJB79_07600 [Candidatus Gastranaerophilales bacterium]|nr:hypothetical protein [Candidatus Gastranaerophilales bacterium]